MDDAKVNGFRWPGGERGHYESWFLRANHPSRPQAFWIRYTVFVPRGRSHAAVGELWAIHFDGEQGRITPVKQVVAWDRTRFSYHALDVTLGEASLAPGQLTGRAACLGHEIAWDLGYQGGGAPLLLLPERLYDGGFPKAKALVAAPGAVFRGTLEVDGARVEIDDWKGSQNHNWGVRHTDQYAWGQVAGFRDAPDAFLEVSTARVRLGPVWTPWMTPLVLRLDGEELRLNALPTAVRADAQYEFFHWQFRTRTAGLTVAGEIQAPATAFVGLPYDNPPGGRKTCLNTKIARCTLEVTRADGRTRRLESPHGAAFEILTDRTDHGVPVLGV